MVDESSAVWRALESGPALPARHVLPIGLICVVIAPAVFWSTVVLAVGLMLQSAVAHHYALAMFVFVSAFLTWVSRAMRVRL